MRHQPTQTTRSRTVKDDPILGPVITIPLSQYLRLIREHKQLSDYVAAFRKGF